MLLSRFSPALLAAAVAAPLLIASPVLAAAQKVVKITAIVEHPALDACRKGALDELAAEGFVPGKNLSVEFQSAQGDVGTAGQIAKKFVGDAPDVIVAIATPSAQAAVAAAHGTVPVVFSAVSDPVGARLVSSLEHPGANVTGVTDRLPLQQHLAMMRQILPHLKRLGVLYNPGEANSVSEVARLKTIAAAQGITVVEGPAPDSNSVLGAARSLAGKVDAFYTPTDNTVVSALEAVVKVGIDTQLPVFAGDTGSVPRGAIAAVGFDYYDVGRQTGKIVARILKGEKPGDIAVEGVNKTNLALNPAMAAKMGITFPPALLKSATTIVK
ncbi:ABC transporter substrate binding protein [mine drainage metagenome]|uniref:ABC transporter substrate binding protein n=1 Tax=mine drainage metagenome TaxID=410659 RepID=A0A1J5R7B7_9ZZZZ